MFHCGRGGCSWTDNMSCSLRSVFCYSHQGKQDVKQGIVSQSMQYITHKWLIKTMHSQTMQCNWKTCTQKNKQTGQAGTRTFRDNALKIILRKGVNGLTKALLVFDSSAWFWLTNHLWSCIACNRTLWCQSSVEKKKLFFVGASRTEPSLPRTKTKRQEGDLKVE